MRILESNSDESLYIQIYKRIRSDIMSGQYPEGSKLPSTRGLANFLNVGRNTVEQAYLQLWSEGYITSKDRSGYYVEKVDITLFSELMKPSIIDMPNISTDEDSSDNYTYDFQYGKLIESDFPIKLWRKMSNQCLNSLDPSMMVSYTNPQGELELRIELKKYLNNYRNVHCQTDQIVICSGTGISLNILSQLFREFSFNIAVEDPGYTGVRNVFYNNGYNIIPISLTNKGINTKELNNSVAKIAYVTPSHQFPTGMIMPIQERLKLLNWANAKQGIIIEDDYDSEYRYDIRPIPSIQGIDLNERVIYLGTFSKVLSPTLRFSYIVLPNSWLKVYRSLFKDYQSTVPLLQQMIVQKFMHLGHWDSHINKICTSKKKIHDLLIQSIQELMGHKAIIHGGYAGLHIMLEINNGYTEKELIESARNYGVRVYPVSKYWIRKEVYSNNMVLLGFSGMSENNIIESIRLLEKAWFK